MPGRDEEEPRQEFRPIGRRADEASGLLAEVEQDRARIEHPRLAAARPLGVDDRRHLAVRVDGAKGGRVLLALGRVDGNDFVRQAELLEHQRDLGRIGRRVEIEADQGALRAWTCRTHTGAAGPQAYEVSPARPRQICGDRRARADCARAGRGYPDHAVCASVLGAPKGLAQRRPRGASPGTTTLRRVARSQ